MRTEKPAPVITMSGAGGELRTGYQVAARLGAWTARVVARGTTEINAVVIWRSEFWVLRRPLDLALRFSNQEWTWTGIDPAIDSNRMNVAVRGGPVVERFSTRFDRR